MDAGGRFLRGFASSVRGVAGVLSRRKRTASVREKKSAGLIGGGSVGVGSLPRPYYDDGDCVIYHGDCAAIVPLLSVDTVFTSPPYNTIPKTSPSGMMRKSHRKLTDGYLSHADDMPEPDYQEWVRDIVAKCLESSQGMVWVNHKTRYRNKRGIHPLSFLPFPLYSEVIWDRGGSTTLNARKFAPSHEFVFGFGEPTHWDRCNDMAMSVWRLAPERGVDGHPCPFPLAIASRCIESSTPAGGTVLDPFMGSGTTLRACKDLGLKSIGIEIEEKYCELAVDRMRQGVLFG